MMSAADPRALESLIAFWVDAGVDATFGEAAVDRTSVATPPPGLASSPSPSRPAPPPAVKTDGAIAAIAQARLMAAAATDLAALAQAIAAFEGCALSTAGARQSVFARGNPDAPLMVIGEAPGADEDVQGAPFVGRAGQLLDRILAAAGLAERVFITNTVFWRPPGNRTPTGAEQQACAPFLERAIQLIAPRIILLVGAAATRSVLGEAKGILAVRGRWFEWRSSDGALTIPALPTLHPAFLLRQPSAKRMAWLDVMTVAERLDRPARPH